MDAKNYWLVAGKIVVRNAAGVTHSHDLNVLLVTTHPAILRMDLAKAQEGMQRRFVTEFEQRKGFKIVDAFIMGISPLGRMTEEEFSTGFEQNVGALAAMTAQPNQAN